MVSSIWKGFFLFVFVLPDILLCDETERPIFLVDPEGNRGYLGLLPGGKRLPEKEFVARSNDPLPESFDVREKWPQCKHITDKIRNQKHGLCGSCWAFSVAGVISDRICIKSNGTTQVLISPEDIMTCCKNECNGCLGGHPPRAFQYWVNQGIVTGGDFNSHEGCRPYTITDDWKDFETPPCNQTCVEGYPIDYTADKHYGLNVYSINTDEKQIQQEIYHNGPVSAGMEVFDDFFDYTKGVHSCPKTDEVINHAIKILGWGVEDGTPYWLCANSWGVQWGENGFFKILRGDPKNGCNIEKYIHAGIPKL